MQRKQSQNPISVLAGEKKKKKKEQGTFPTLCFPKTGRNIKGHLFPLNFIAFVHFPISSLWGWEKTGQAIPKQVWTIAWMPRECPASWCLWLAGGMSRRADPSRAQPGAVGLLGWPQSKSMHSNPTITPRWDLGKQGLNTS